MVELVVMVVSGGDGGSRGVCVVRGTHHLAPVLGRGAAGARVQPDLNITTCWLIIALMIVIRRRDTATGRPPAMLMERIVYKIVVDMHLVDSLFKSI